MSWYFERSAPGGYDVFVSLAVGKLLSFFYEKDNSFAANDPEVRSVPALTFATAATADDVNQFRAQLESKATYLQVIELARDGLSYVQISSVMSGYRSTFSIVASTHNAVTRHAAGKYIRLVDAIGLDSIGKALSSSWCYAVAADGSAQIHGRAYFSVRVRLVTLDGKRSSLSNLHICAPPLTDAHTGENMHSMTVAILKALDGQWDRKLSGATSDGARNMTGVYKGWQSRLKRDCVENGPFGTIHCGPHKINLVNVVTVAALKLTGSSRHQNLTKVIKWLRKEQGLIEGMGMQAPYHIEVRWSSLARVLDWHRSNAPTLQTFYFLCDKGKYNSFAEAPAWWLFLTVFSEHFRLIKRAMSAMQTNLFLLEQQVRRVSELMEDLCDLHGVSFHVDLTSDTVGNGSVEEAEDPGVIRTEGTGVNTVAKLGPFSIQYDKILADIGSYGLDAADALDALNELDDREALKMDVAKDVAAIALTAVNCFYVMGEAAKRE